MALLNYSAFASLDGYIADEQGDFSWAMPSPEAHTLANELMEPIGTCIYGRRMYEMMTYWDTPEAIDEGSGIEYDFAMTWRAADKIVYSRTLAEVSTARTRLEREFRPDDIRKLKAESTGDIEIGGPTLAAAALHAQKGALGTSYADIAAAAFAQRGISVRGLSRNQIASKVFAAQTTSDFPNLLSSVAGKVLRSAYGNFPNTWNKWAAAGSVSDFKIHPRLQLGSFNGLDTIAEGGEYTYGSLKEDYENAQAVTKGKAIALTRQMIVNDDIGAFNRRAALMGRAAARSVNVDAYTFLTSGSSAHGPTSADGGQYFNATAVTTAGGHANLTSSGTAISVASLGVGRAAMRKQKDKGVRETLNIEPAILLTSVAKEDLARQVITSEADPASSNSGVTNIYRNRFEVVSDPVIDGVNSGLSWYLFANPADVAGFEVVFLDGIQEPFVDETVDFDTDAMKFKVRLDYGVAIGDWRAGYKNVGA